MKKTITLLAIIFTVVIARAQYVSIPDTAFGDWLNQSGFSSCMTGNSNSGWRLDTSCSAVTNATSMNIDNVQGQLLYLQGIQYFKNLRYLSLNNLEFLSSLPALPPALDTFLCVNNGQLTAIPALPATLQTLNCSQNGGLSSLPALPSPLTYLNCSRNNLGILPLLPGGLVYLDCSANNQLTFIPPLPSVLAYLDCSGNNIDSLPLLPDVLDTFICMGNMLTKLPVLPNSLIYLDCWANHNLTSLPALPSSLNYLSCGEDPFSGDLPSLPASLAYLSCFDSHITSLPSLPALLTYLDCSQNSLTFIPPLPDSLSWFDCSYNADLACLPHLNAVVHLNFTNTAVTCILNLPTSNTYTNPTVPICTGNTCSSASGISEVAGEHFSVYPNPASNYIMVESSRGINQLRLCNMLGQTVYSISGNNNVVMNLDISALQAGLYIIEAYSANGVNTAKIIVGN